RRRRAQPRRHRRGTSCAREGREPRRRPGQHHRRRLRDRRRCACERRRHARASAAGRRGRGHARRDRGGPGCRHGRHAGRRASRRGRGDPAPASSAPPRRVARDSLAGRRRRRRPLRGVRALTLSFRTRELVFLIAVGVLTAVGFASVYIARQDVVSTASLTYAGFFFLLYAAAHLVARYTVPFADPYLLPIAGLLTAIGLTEIYRLHPADAFKQATWIVVAVALFALTLFLLRYDYRRLETYKYIFGLTAIGLLLLPILPVIGLTVNGARLWVHVGALRFQPGELAKIALIIFLAGYMREKREVLAQGRLKDWGPLLVICALAMLVLLETRDLGGGLLYFGIFLSMLYVATSRLSYVAAGLGLFLIGAVGVWKITPHVQDRVTIWLHPWTAHKVYCPLNGEMAL